MNYKYFDHAATTTLDEEVLNAMIPYFQIDYGNASSLYTLGRKSKRAIELSRETVARELNCNKNEIYFTSCGSESDNLAIKGIAYLHKSNGNHIITSKIEHPAVLNTCKKLERQGFVVTYLNVDKYGIIDLQELENKITDKTILISIMFANNEIGTIQPIHQIGEIAKKHNIFFHTDAVQAIGNIKIDVKKMNINLLSMSAHKFYGPKGIGALYVQDGIDFEKIQDGGHQEKDKRAGTENVPGIVGLGKAIELSYKNYENNNIKITNLREYFINEILSKIPDIKLNGHRKNRLPGNANISFKGIEGEELLLKLDELGICASSGSACSSGHSEPSHVLTAIGLSQELSYGTLRITIGKENTQNDIDYLINNLIKIIQILRNKK